jgi:thiamine-phosphate pyrophosphorylase
MQPVIVAEAFLEGGATILQFRHKAFWSRDIFEQARQIAALCQQAHAIFILNDRADYAALLSAGLHVGQDDLSPADARRLIGPDAMLGYSTHNPDQVRDAFTEPVDYVAFGPVFSTVSKERADPTVGIEGLRTARALTTRPLVAIGGITLSNAQSCFTAGANSVAIIGGLLPASLPFSAPRQTLRERMAEWQSMAAIR